MSLIHTVQIACDHIGCFEAYQAESFDVDSALRQRQKARGEGWAVARPGGLDFCPKHYRSGTDAEVGNG